MKCSWIAAALIGTSAAAFAQDVAELAERRDAKLAEAWVSQADWETDFATARERAKKEGKMIFAYFSRSYAP